MADKPNFRLADELATQILLSQPKFNSLEIDVTQLQYDYDIIFDSMQNYCKITGTTWERMGFEKVKNGHTVKIDTDKYLVLYNEEHSPERINWTVGHEVGHIYFGHKDDGKKSEIETSCFTAQLITPESPIRKLAHEFGFLDFGWIYNNFFVSLQSSVKRVNTLNSKYYTWDKSSSLLINQFKAPMQNLVEFFWKNSDQFNIDLAYAHFLLEEYSLTYEDSYSIKSNNKTKKCVSRREIAFY